MIQRIVLSAALSLTFLGTARAQTRPTSNPASGPATTPAVIAVDTAPELDAKVPADFVEHRDADSGASVRAPKDWQAAKPASANTKLNLVADAQRRTVSLVVVPAMRGATLPALIEKTPEALGGQFEGFKLHRADVVKLNGQPAARLVYESVLGKDIKMRSCQFMVLRNGNQYVLTYTARDAEFDALLPTAEQVAASLRVP